MTVRRRHQRVYINWYHTRVTVGEGVSCDRCLTADVRLAKQRAATTTEAYHTTIFIHFIYCLFLRKQDKRRTDPTFDEIDLLGGT